jgi:hypothetical protein
MIALPDRAWALQGVGAHRMEDTSLEAAAGWFAHRAPAEAEAGREGRRAAHSGRCVFGPESRGGEGRRRARGRRPAPARRRE